MGGVMDSQFVKEFNQYLIVNKLSVDSLEVRQLVERVADVLGTESCKFSSVYSNVFLKNHLLQARHKDGLIKALEGLENAFNSLMVYGLNLLKYGGRKEYCTIKTYTGYFVCHISDHVGVFGCDTLKSMGYGYREEGLKDELVLGKLSGLIFDVTYQIFLSIALTRKMLFIAKCITSNGYSDEVAARVIAKIDHKELKMNEILDSCKLVKSELSRSFANMSMNREQNANKAYIYSEAANLVAVRGHSGPSSLMFDQAHAEIPDLELYGTGRSNNVAMDDGASNAALCEPSENMYDEPRMLRMQDEVKLPPSFAATAASSQNSSHGDSYGNVSDNLLYGSFVGSYANGSSLGEVSSFASTHLRDADFQRHRGMQLGTGRRSPYMPNDYPYTQRCDIPRSFSDGPVDRRMGRDATLDWNQEISYRRLAYEHSQALPKSLSDGNRRLVADMPPDATQELVKRRPGHESEARVPKLYES